MRINIAGLCIQIEEGVFPLSLEDLPCHLKFRDVPGLEPPAAQLNLSFTTEAAPKNLAGPLCRNEIWELWQDECGNFIFTQPAQTPQRWVLVNPDFTAGRIFGDFGALKGEPFFPLKYLDIVLYSNWLALRGDLILHASGVIWEDAACVFMGNSGAGKSTLAADLQEAHGLTVLGEDQIIIRRVDDKFIAFGTPWHENPTRCDPRGVPLGKLFFLDRAADRTLTPLSGFDAAVRIMTTAFVPYYLPARVQAILENVARLTAEHTAFVLAYQRGTDIIEVIRGA